MYKIPNGFGSMKDLLKRSEKANENWEAWRSIHQDAYDYSAPQRETFNKYSAGQKKGSQVFDSTAIDGLVTFSNRLQGSLVPSWVQWMNIVPGNTPPEFDVVAGQFVPLNLDNFKRRLEYQTKIFFNSLNHSNFSTEITPSFIDLGIGTGAIEVNEGDFTKDEPLVFQNVPLSELRPETPINGKIENVWRIQEIEAGLIKQTWPKAILPQRIEKKAVDNPYNKENILNAFLYNTKDLKYYQIVIHKDSKSVIFVQSFNSKRLIVFRWHVTPGETFGRGPIIQNLDDIRTCNIVKKMILKNASIQIAGVYTAVDDGIFNPSTVRIAPGAIIPVSSNRSTDPSIQALPRAGDIGLGGIVIEDLQNSIKKALLSDPMGEISDPVRTATEQMIRMQEALKDRGASFGRLKSELIEPLVSAVIDILSKLGRMDDIIVDGRAITLRHQSPLAKAEDMEDFQSSQVWYSMLSQIDPQIVSGVVKVEELPKYWGDKLGVPAFLLRNEKERAEFGQKVFETAQQMQAMGMGGQQ